MLKKKLVSASLVCAMAFNSLLMVPFATSAEELKFEFEDGTQTGEATVLSDLDGYSGTGYVFLMDNDDTVSVTVTVPSEGLYNLKIGYAAVYGDKIQNLLVNGVQQASLSFPEGTSFEEMDCGSVRLNAGENTITIQGSWGWTLFDYVTLSGEEAPTLACSNVLSDPDASSEAQGLMNYMATVYGSYIISGQQEVYGGGHSGNYEYEFDYLYDLTGEYPAIRGFDFMNYNPLYGWDDGTTERVIDWVNNRGGIATASWHINVPKDFENYTLGDKLSWTDCTYGVDTDFSPSNIVNDPTSKEYAYFELIVDQLATELLELQDAGVPIILRPFHEAEGGGGEAGSWFWWGKDGSSTYKKLWRLLYTKLTEEYGLHNIIWEFNSYTYSTSKNWYPGDDYVDLVGYDKYNATANSPNESAISATFSNLVSLYGGAGKMISMAECDTIPSIDNMLSEDAYWLYFCPWYEDDSSDNSKFLSLYNNADTLKAIYTSDSVITLSELPDYKNYEYTGEEFVPESTEPTTEEEPTTEPEEGHAKISVNPVSGNYAIVLPEAVGDKLYLTVELDEGITLANGGLGVSIEVDGEYYWANIKWETTKSGTITVNIPDDLLNVTLGTDPVTDEAILAAVETALQKQTKFEGQIWYAADEDGESTSTDGVKITDAYIASAVKETDPAETDVLYGDVNSDGTVNIMDVIVLNKYLMDTYEISEAGQLNADVDGDGTPTASDSLNIMRYIVKLINTLPV